MNEQMNEWKLPPEANRVADAQIQTILDLNIDILSWKEWESIKQRIADTFHFPQVINDRIYNKIQSVIFQKMQESYDCITGTIPPGKLETENPDIIITRVE